MARSSGTWVKGKAKGKPKGAVTHTTQKAKELILAAIDNQSEKFNATMSQLQHEEPKEWAKIMVKLMDFVLPKKVDVTTDGHSIPAPIIELTK